MVHQHFSLVEALTVWENVALGDVGRLDPQRDRASGSARSASSTASTIDPDDRIADLSAGMRQRVEIIKCLRRDPAGARLRRADVGAVAGRVGVPVRRAAPRRRGGGQGRRARQPQAAGDPVGDRRDHDHARRPGRRRPARRRSSDAASLARAMVGREVSLRGERAALRRRRQPPRRGPTAIADGARAGTRAPVAADRRRHGAQPATAGCCSTGSRSTCTPGEIVGVAGVEGNGQRALGDVLSSLRRARRRARSRSTARASSRAGPGRWRAPASRSSPRTATTPGACSTSPSPRTCSSPTPSRVARRGLIDRRLMRAAGRAS